MASANKRKPYLHTCGVPKDSCSGTSSRVNMALGTSRKLHPSPEDAFRCRQRYLIKEGYRQLGPRDFQDPNTGEVLVLTKPSRYGAMLRNGKEGTRNMSNVKIRGGGRRGGNIASL
jgi:hypothetical protein